MRRASLGVDDGANLASPDDFWGPAWTPETVIDTLEPLAEEQRRARIRSVVEARIGSVTVLMDAPHDPHNGAAVVRTCEAFGVSVIHIVPRGEAFLIARKVTRGTERWVDVRVHPTPKHAAEALSEAGFELVAADPEGELEPEDLARLPRVALVLGNEHDGIRDALRNEARRSVRIPMHGFVESLNVSVAGAILVAAATRGRPGDLPAAEKRRLHARYLCRSVPRALEILAARKPA